MATWGQPLQQHLRQEQAHTAACLRATAQLQKRLVAEMLGRHAHAVVRKAEQFCKITCLHAMHTVQPGIQTVCAAAQSPAQARLGNYVYHQVSSPERPKMCIVRRCHHTGKEQVVLDLNDEAHGGAAMGTVGMQASVISVILVMPRSQFLLSQIKAGRADEIKDVVVLQMELSKSQQLVAYTLDDGMGSEVYRTSIRHIASGKRLRYNCSLLSMSCSISCWRTYTAQVQFLSGQGVWKGF